MLADSAAGLNLAAVSLPAVDKTLGPEGHLLSALLWSIRHTVQAPRLSFSHQSVWYYDKRRI